MERNRSSLGTFYLDFICPFLSFIFHFLCLFFPFISIIFITWIASIGQTADDIRETKEEDLKKMADETQQRQRED